MGLSNRVLAWHLLRVSLGMNFLLHGLVRLPNLSGFAQGMQSNFAETVLPGPLVLAFGHVLPFVEAVLGGWLVSGLRSRWALVAGSLLMLILQFGTALRQDWNALAIQMLYSLIYFQLLAAAPEE